MTKITIEEYNKLVVAILESKGIDLAILGKRESLKTEGLAAQVSFGILLQSGMNNRIAHAAVYGMFVEAQGEMQGSMGGGIDGYYCGVMLEKAWDFGSNYIMGNELCEVGMKYPLHNNKNLLIDKYGLTLTGEYSPKFNEERSPESQVVYDVWGNKETGISFSFVRGEMFGPTCRYAGGIFPNFEEAYKFGKWFLGLKRLYIKDIGLFVNNLGGQSIRDLTYVEIIKSVHNQISAY